MKLEDDTSPGGGQKPKITLRLPETIASSESATITNIRTPVQPEPVAHKPSAQIAHWFQGNTFYPSWQPGRLRHPVIGYLLALLMQVIALFATLLLLYIFPDYPFPALLLILCIVLTAINWGAGPSLISTVIGLLLLNFFVEPTRDIMTFRHWENILEILLFLIVGATISILSSKVERARRDSEEISHKLAQERAYLETVIETVADTVSIHDTQGRITRLNHPIMAEAPDQQHPILAPAEAIQVFDIRTLDNRTFPVEQMPINRALQGETVSAVEIICRDRHEQQLYLSISAAPLRNPAGAIEGVVAVSHDISALRQTQKEAAVRASELESIFEALTDGILFYDQQGNLRHINSAARELIILNESEVEQDPLPQKLSLSDEQGNLIPLEQWPEKRIIRGEVLKGSSAMDVVARNQQGRVVNLNISGAPVRQPDGKQVGAVCICHDITDRRNLEQRTHKALNALLEMAQALVMVSHDTTPLVAEQAEIEKTAEVVEEVARDTHVPRQIVKVAQRLAELTCRVLECKRVRIHTFEEETELIRPLAYYGLEEEHQRIWNEARKQGLHINDPELIGRLYAHEISVIDMTKAPYKDQPNPYAVEKMLIAPISLGEQLVGILILDHAEEAHEYTAEEMTLAGAVARLSALGIERERLVHERAQAQANELALREANRRMDEFLGMASHELKTPLTSIKGNTQLTYRQLRNSMERMQGLFESTERQIRRMNRLVDDLLDISRTQSDHLEIQPGRSDLIKVVETVVGEVRGAWPERTIKENCPDQPAPVYIDIDRIEQVITNYLTNALKYSYKDRPVEITIEVKQQAVRVSVRDEGPGLSEEEQQRIWERFHRVNGIEVRSSTHDSLAGLGLGLYISKTIIEHHEGEVGVQSVVNEGSTFWFELPLADGSEPEQTEQQEASSLSEDADQ